MREKGLDAEALEVYHHEPDISGFDVLASPVHLPPGNPALEAAKALGIETVTHHRAVGALLFEDKDFRVFEITGTHSKTSTALVLSRILSFERKVVSHTTRGVELWQGGESQIIKAGLSITPGNVIYAFDAARANEADDLICEISLGGTGLADYGVLTSFAGDYRIANDSMWASKAKLQMVELAAPGSKLVANADTGTAPDLSFGEGGKVQCTSKELRMGQDRCALELGENFDPQSYLTALSAASAVAIASGLGPVKIASALKGFDGLRGRMKRTYEKGMIVYDNSNSGLKVSGVEEALDYSLGEGQLGLVVGEEAETVCEGMNVPELVELLRLRREGIDVLILVGERLEPYAAKLRASTAPDLVSGQSIVEGALDRGDRILTCVKCFR